MEEKLTIDEALNRLDKPVLVAIIKTVLDLHYKHSKVGLIQELLTLTEKSKEKK